MAKRPSICIAFDRSQYEEGDRCGWYAFFLIRTRSKGLLGETKDLGWWHVELAGMACPDTRQRENHVGRRTLPSDHDLWREYFCSFLNTEMLKWGAWCMMIHRLPIQAAKMRVSERILPPKHLSIRHGLSLYIERGPRLETCHHRETSILLFQYLNLSFLLHFLNEEKDPAWYTRSAWWPEPCLASSERSL